MRLKFIATTYRKTAYSIELKNFIAAAVTTEPTLERVRQVVVAEVNPLTESQYRIMIWIALSIGFEATFDCPLSLRLYFPETDGFPMV